MTEEMASRIRKMEQIDLEGLTEIKAKEMEGGAA